MKIKRALLPLVFTFGLLATGCGFVKSFEKDINVVVMNVTNPSAGEDNWDYQEVYRTKVNAFNSAILPVNELEIPGKQFLGYGINPFEKGVSKRKDFYKNKGLVRYDDVKQYAKNNTVTLKATYVNPEDFPYQYIVFGWYGKTSTSGLDSEKMDRFETLLREHVKETAPEKVDPTDIELREYIGGVADIGGNINADEDVDIFIGAGANLKTEGGVEYVTRTFMSIPGVTDRYVYKLNNRSSTSEIYDWVKSPEVRAFFAEE